MLNVKVAQKQSLTEDIVRVKLISADNTPLPAWEPGAHIELHLANGLLRQYSLCGKSTAEYYEIAILREKDSRGGSAFIHEQLQMFDELLISEPRNHFPFRGQSQDETSIFLAAGIGITPILPMAEWCVANNLPFEMSVCASTYSTLPYIDRINVLPGTRCYLSQESQSGRLNIREYLAGKPTTMPIYVCGPQRFIDEVTDSAKDLGWDDKPINREYFSFDNSHNEKEAKAFDVEIKSTSQIIHIPADKTILNTLEDHGIFLPVACEEGVCGTCVTKVLEGQVDHRDVFFNDEERASGELITPCCSRAKSSKLILDL